MNIGFSLFWGFIILLSTIGFSEVNFNLFKTCINKHCFDTRIADNPISRGRGLIGEEYLPKNEGMLFIFPVSSTPEFWMKNTKIHLDILFINDNDTIVYAVKNAPPCLSNEKCPTYKPNHPVSRVLEINGGLSNELNIKVGDQVEYFIEDD